MGLQEMYEPMNGEFMSSQTPWTWADQIAMEPEEAAPTVTDFMETVDMSMTGKLWAPSESQFTSTSLGRFRQPLIFPIPFPPGISSRSPYSSSPHPSLHFFHVNLLYIPSSTVRSHLDPPALLGREL